MRFNDFIDLAYENELEPRDYLEFLLEYQR